MRLLSSLPSSVLAIALVGVVSLHGQQPTHTVVVRLGELQKECYPSCAHPSEWLQHVYADVFDSTGAPVTDTSAIYYDWGVNFCVGSPLQFGYIAGYGLNYLAVDGNLSKSSAGCCEECPFQTYYLAVRITFVDDMSFTSNAVLVPDIQIPTDIGVSQNFPNPFNSSTRVTFRIKNRSTVRLTIYDIQGRVITTLADRSFDAGYHFLDWRPSNIASGTYVCRMTVDEGKGRRFEDAIRLVYEK